MNLLEAQLDYPFGEALPEGARLIQVAPGVRWVRMGLPFALNHINLWLLEDTLADEHGARRGWTVVDCGIADAHTRASWEDLFVGALQGLPILRVLVTHCHPDHVGLAEWLCQRWQVGLWMSTGEYTYARLMSAALPGFAGAAALPHFQRHGVVDPALLTQLAGRASYYPTLAPAVPTSYIRLQDDQVVRIGAHHWRVITGFGHAPEHVSLYCADLNLMISGDMVLPRISTNVSVAAVEPEGNPLRQYLDSLAKLHPLPDDVLVLPSHGKPFRGLHTRIEQLNAHHAARLAEVVVACALPQSAADIVPIMFPRALDAHQMGFALGEALAHLHLLWHEGVVRREMGADGVLRFGTIVQTDQRSESVAATC